MLCFTSGVCASVLEKCASMLQRLVRSSGIYRIWENTVMSVSHSEVEPEIKTLLIVTTFKLIAVITGAMTELFT